MFVKICGITDPGVLDAAVAAGADAVGFVFAESPRQVSVPDARALADRLPAGVLKVAVFRRPDPGTLAGVIDALRPDLVQADADALSGIDLPDGVDTLPVYRSVREVWTAPPARLLFEGPASGIGAMADWEEARAVARRARVVLAGGLDPYNVADAITRVRPWGVDVSSGVESAPGRKDPARITAFVSAARAAAGAIDGRTNDHR
ncbi:MAG: phosphoribosylanthranilate isomerase [Actinomycetes bacterium]|nr:MAG: phosphoribosylanthranilate isomerase [Actinomycetota bacterium]